jgi:heptosyltransferase-2
VSRLLVVAPNWLGDAVMALPAIADVRRAMPDADIVVSARPPVAPLFAMVPEVGGGPERAAPLQAGSGATLQGRDPQIALLLPNSFHSAFTVARAGIPERWGYRTDWRGRLLTRAIEKPRGVHQVEYYQHLTRALGFPSGPAVPRVSVSDRLRDAARAVLRDQGWTGDGPFVALAPGAAYGGAKRWPPDYFAELARTLAADGVSSAIVGSAADAPTRNELIAALGPGVRIIDLVGRTDLPTLAGVLSLCRACVANDSGAMHLAAAVGVPVVAIFGPTNDRATAPRPPTSDLGPPTSVLIHDVWCRPCMLRECPLDHACMRGVEPARAMAALREVACR